MQSFIRRFARNSAAAVLSIILATALSASVAPPVAAQDQPAVFVHGINSSGASWEMAAQRLKTELKITKLNPDLPWKSVIETQARNLHDQTRDWLDATGQQRSDSLIAFGHSMGGLTSRMWTRQSGNVVRPNRIATIGSPHAGAHIAFSLLTPDSSKNFFSWAASGAKYVLTPPFRYMELLDNAYGVDYPLGDFIYWLDIVGRNVGNFVQRLPEWVNGSLDVTTLVGGAVVPSLAQLNDQGTWIPQLQGGTEPGVRKKVALVSTSGTNYDLFFHSIFADQNVAASAAEYKQQGIYLYLFAFAYFEWFMPWSYDMQNEGLYQMHNHAGEWLRGAIWMMDLDPVWCITIGTYESAYFFGPGGLYTVNCAPSDGWVPAASQRAFAGAEVLEQVPGIDGTHTRQKGSSRLITEFARVINTKFQVNKRDPTEVTRVDITPLNSSTTEGGLVQFTARGYRADGTQVTGFPTYWSSSMANVATIDDNGLLTARYYGTTTVQASMGGRIATANMTVNQATFDAVYIYGPEIIRTTDNNCTWNASTRGGTPPFTYSWYMNGRWAGAGYTYTGSNAGSPFTLELAATDAAGRRLWASFDVGTSTDSRTQMCAM